MSKSVLAGAQQLANVDERAVDRNALRGVFWWVDSRTLMADGELIVDGGV